MSVEKVCILVVDDDPAGLYVKCRMLRRAGFEVEEAVTGADAMRLVKSKRSQLLLLDVQLPDMNGLEICETLKADPEYNSIPILQTSATFTNPADAAAGLNRGADAYLAEPLKEDVLIATINALLRARRAEEELRKQREWLHVTLKSIGDAVVATDLQNRVVFMNPVAESLSGWSSADAHAIAIADVLNLVNAQTREKLALPLARILREEGGLGIAEGIVLISKNGMEYPVEDSIAPIRDLSGQSSGMVVVFRGIGERKRAELRMLQLLASEQNARREAEKANRSKDEFLAVVSHELRTPLTAIMGWARLLKGGSLGLKETKHAIDVIERNVRSQTQIIEDILDISRIIAGKLTLNEELINLKDVVRNSIESIRAAASVNNINIRSTLEPIPFLGDPMRLQQVLWNLLTNAIKFTPANGFIEVSLSASTTGIKIVIKDSGIGITPEFLPLVFDRFAQDDASSTRKTGGLGIGLSIVQNLVRMHRGEVVASSDGPNKGSTFTITFPFPDLSTIPIGDSEPTLASRGDIRLDRLHILVVEDDANTREMLSLVFSTAGAEVSVAGSAREAMKAIQHKRPAVIVSDIGLPEEDGFSFIRQLRKFETSMGGSIPALALTAYAKPENKWQALEAGFQMFAAKPIDSPNLINMVAELGGLSRSDSTPNDKIS